MLTDAQRAAYDRDGVIIVPDVFSPDEIAEMLRVTDQFVADSVKVTANDAVYDLEDTHSAADPRVRRLKAPHAIHPVFAASSRNEKVVAILRDLWGSVRFDSGKLNMKSAGYGAPIEWHQDWAFYPHTNDDLAAVGIMLDDVDMENGPMMVVPGTHKGPTYDHHGADGRFCGAMDPDTCALDVSRAIPCIGKAGTISIHHVRAVHGSATNFSGKPRRFLLWQYRAADAWPLLGLKEGIGKFHDQLLVGENSLAPRLVHAPVRMPLPPAEYQGSIYENQRASGRRYFAAAPVSQIAAE
ncbi:MAG TPA: phytanoyl-CoA dioxygenase family protein [Stellaceae bacterium]|jgi:ectoine hydroxylase-related dioxygenase (phytanoyl-CoA dioxygenase family)|nr:phytanoyl-CoA dioxygenase family protein [Stellaceae bacterium]